MPKKATEMCEKCDKLRGILAEVQTKVSGFEASDVIDADIIKTLKAMFYEDACEILNLRSGKFNA